MYNETNSPLHSRNKYPRSTEARTRRQNKDRLMVGALALAAVPTVIFAANNSDKVSEAFRSSPLHVSEQLSEANYQTSVIRPALTEVESTIDSIQVVQRYLEQNDALDKGSYEVKGDGRSDKYTLSSGPESVRYIQINDSGNPEDEGNVQSSSDGGIEISRDDNGTSIVVEDNSVTLVDGLGGFHDSEITFHNPKKDMVIDMTDLSTVIRAISDPETIVEKATAAGSFSSTADSDQSWSASLETPLTVTFMQNANGSFDASANTQDLRAGYGVSSKATPDMDDVLRFTLNR